jgi:hypothetical protein
VALSSLLYVVAHEYSPFEGPWRHGYAIGVPILFELANELTDETFCHEDVAEYTVDPVVLTLFRITW